MKRNVVRPIVEKLQSAFSPIPAVSLTPLAAAAAPQISTNQNPKNSFVSVSTVIPAAAAAAGAPCQQRQQQQPEM